MGRTRVEKPARSEAARGARDKHVFGVEKLGGRPLEEAFPEVARRLSMSDASDGTAGARAHQSSFQGQKVLFSLGRSPQQRGVA